MLCFTLNASIIVPLFPPYRRLAKSTLLLIPLFGMNYIIFAYIPEHIHLHVRMVFDLVLGSFQVGFSLPSALGHIGNA